MNALSPSFRHFEGWLKVVHWFKPSNPKPSLIYNVDGRSGIEMVNVYVCPVSFLLCAVRVTCWKRVPVFTGIVLLSWSTERGSLPCPWDHVVFCCVRFHYSGVCAGGYGDSALVLVDLK